MLTLTDVTKTFNPGTVNEKTAISHLSLHLAPGDFVTIIGSNGAGKSTLLSAVAGSFYVDNGSIRLDSRDITFVPEHRRSPGTSPSSRSTAAAASSAACSRTP